MEDPSTTSSSTSLYALTPLQRWIVLHDRSLVFATLYISLTVVLSIFVGYFWLFAIVAVHVLLEWLKKGYLGYHRGGHRMAWTLWDTKFDIALLFLAVTLLSYTGVNAGAAGAQSASRFSMLGSRLGTFGSRMGHFLSRLSSLGAILQRVGLKAVDVFFSARVFLFRHADMTRSKRTEGFLDGLAQPELVDEDTDEDAEEGAVTPEYVPRHLPWQRKLNGKAWFVLIVIVFNAAAILAAPLLTDHSYASLLQTLGARLHPWPL